MALDLLFQQALREVVEEIKGYSKEEFELKLADSKKSSFALTIDSLMGFQYVRENVHSLAMAES